MIWIEQSKSVFFGCDDNNGHYDNFLKACCVTFQLYTHICVCACVDVFRYIKLQKTFFYLQVISV